MVDFTVVIALFRDEQPAGPAVPVPTLTTGGGPAGAIPPPNWDWVSVCRSIERFWLEASGGRETPSVDVHPTAAIITMPQADRVNENVLTLTRLEQEVRDVAPRLRTDRRLIIIRNDQGCPYAGLGAYDTDPAVRADRMDPSTICHEMGHFYGAMHACQLQGFAPNQYFDPTCVMGGPDHAFDFRDPALQPQANGLPAVNPGILTLSGPMMAPSTMQSAGTPAPGGPEGWLDLTSQAVASPVPPTGTLVRLHPWRGAPPTQLADDFQRLLVVAGATTELGRLYVSVRERSDWDREFPAALTLVAQELTDRNVSLFLGSVVDPQPGNKLRTDRSEYAVEVVETTTEWVMVQLVDDPWRAGYTLTGRTFDSRIAAAAWPDPATQRMDIFVIDDGGTVVNRTFEHGVWQEWADLDGALFDERTAIAAAAVEEGRVDVFVLRGDGVVVRRTRRDGAWGTWVDLPGRPEMVLDDTCHMTATPLEGTTVYLAVTDGNHAVWYAHVDENNVFTWIPLPDDGFQMGSIAAAHDTDGGMWVHAVTLNDSDAPIWSYDMAQGHRGDWEARVGLASDEFETWRTSIAATGVAPGQALVTSTDPLLFLQRVFGQWPGAGGWDREPALFALPNEASVAVVSRDNIGVDILYVGADHLVHGQGRSVGNSFQQATRQIQGRRRVTLENGLNGMYVSAHGGGGGGVAANRPDVGPWEVFEELDLGPVQGDGADVHQAVAYVTSDGRHILTCANPMFGGLAVTGEGTFVGDWEVFIKEDLPGFSTNALRALNGNYVEVGVDALLAAMGESAGPAQSFSVRAH